MFEMCKIHSYDCSNQFVWYTKHTSMAQGIYYVVKLTDCALSGHILPPFHTDMFTIKITHQVSGICVYVVTTDIALGSKPGAATLKTVAETELGIVRSFSVVSGEGSPVASREERGDIDDPIVDQIICIGISIQCSHLQLKSSLST